MITEEHLAERFRAVASSENDSDWNEVRRKARNRRLRGIAPLALAAFILLAAPAVAFQDQVAQLFVQGDDPPPNERTVTTFFGEEPAGLSARMEQAVANGPYEIQCEAGDDPSLVCHGIRGKETHAALKRGETVYGRTVIGIPRGARLGVEDASPSFESTDLVCANRSGASLVCFPVTVMQPTIRAGADVFAFYRRHNVTFTKRGTPVGHAGDLTVSFRIVPKERP